jgi:hypothetical protein
MFIECDDVTSQNGQKPTSEPSRRAVLLRNVTPKLCCEAIFARVGWAPARHLVARRIGGREPTLHFPATCLADPP